MNLTASIIQAAWKGYLIRKQFKYMKNSVILVQRTFREHKFVSSIPKTKSKVKSKTKSKTKSKIKTKT